MNLEPHHVAILHGGHICSWKPRLYAPRDALRGQVQVNSVMDMDAVIV